MILVEPVRDKNILIITPQGPLEQADFERIATEVELCLDANGKLNGLMIIIESFPGWKSFEAMAAHLKFVSGHHRQIERLAVVTRSRFLRIIPAVARYFVHPEVRLFDIGQRAPALSWLETGRR
ncbi:STAS/SEC14 domain-containing protein [Rhizobium sp. NLR9b]|uniref:STAS/SEC14 domain-containing protein n=1 Tax=unclassified Rhizobium TaxID=2613769 RepID=UPI001C8282C1|nr:MULTISPECIES: STAS/SEC14 domain-containing protein [unclassified Rhizobium]MBX5226256.1 STAS/SEC14 domain-containing protein [Rhizobium sp. NLR9b]MBX5286929.1 STAS/SEC14 domain-containing protein [Rhizobium sp. NLR10b]